MTSSTTTTAADLAEWVTQFSPTEADLELADRALVDTVACAIAARHEPILVRARSLGDAGRWAIASHILDFDDLHMPSTSHISTVCVPATLASGGGARDYLAGAGVMARIGTALGWAHYCAGWHATTTSGALGAAACAASTLGLDAERTAIALAHAVPAAGGVQRAFGTDAKSLQVGFAVDAGLLAASLAADGATADPRAVDIWMQLVGSESTAVTDLGAESPAIPDGLAIKLYPCCYALQRAIVATHELHGRVSPEHVTRIVVRTPSSTVQPLVHHRPTTGLEGKFSLEYAVAAALLDDYCGFTTFTDHAVQRAEAQRLMCLVEVVTCSGGTGLLSGEVDVIVHVGDDVHQSTLELPPGAPGRPPSDAELSRKIGECLAQSGHVMSEITWANSASLLRTAVLGDAVSTRIPGSSLMPTDQPMG